MPDTVSSLELSRAEAQELDSRGLATGVEEESLEGGEGPASDIERPFDPEKIDVVTRPALVELLLARIRDNRIDLEPDFQRRRGIWTQKAKSRLIESLLLRIPLPVFYAAEDEEERWIVVDGIQRLTAISEFIEPAALGAQPLVLKELEYLPQYDGMVFQDLPGRLQTRLREAELVLNLIRRGTPEEVKFNIFARINTGGLALSAQELRHAIIGGRARDHLREWAESDAFVSATRGSIRSERMADREMVLRFVAFHLLGPEGYRSDDFDGFLREAMAMLNRLPANDVERLGSDLHRSLRAAERIFGSYAFRKRTVGDPDRRNPINKALFETITVSLADTSDESLDELAARAGELENSFLSLMDDYQFQQSVSVGTGQISRVRYRFERIDNLFREVLR